MPVLGVTGGVATGKSTCTRLLADALSAAVFDTDVCARDLMTSDPEVATEMRTAFGSELLDPVTGQTDRARLRSLVFSSATHRRALENILHPRIRQRWMGWAQQGLQNAPDAVLLVEIPLLYETDACVLVDEVIVVGCSTATQQQRLTVNRRLSPELAQQIIDSQWPLAEKVRRCDSLLWNDGSPSCLHEQVALCASHYHSRPSPG